MKTTARARIERAVEKLADREGYGCAQSEIVIREDVIKLILAERARLKREVTKTRAITVSMCSTSEFCKGYHQACGDILALWEE